MNETIVNFIQQQQIASICCVDEYNNPYCFTCFFAFNRRDGLLYFKSSASSHHIKLLLRQTQVAGTILPGKLEPLSMKGIQFGGMVLPEGHSLTSNAVNSYHFKYPFAMAMPGKVYTIQLTHVKMTDNSKGFGKKITWERNKPATV